MRQILGTAQVHAKVLTSAKLTNVNSAMTLGCSALQIQQAFHC